LVAPEKNNGIGVVACPTTAIVDRVTDWGH
jgi:hypothetical protein